MKVLFSDIRRGDVGAVLARLDAQPELVTATAAAPPRKDDGQSTLQVAIKSGQFEIAHLLIDRGADVNFIDTSTLNRWNTPVVHDAIRAAVFSSRFGRNRAVPGEPAAIEVINTEEQFTRALRVLVRLLEAGADVNKLDSMGNPALNRAILDARQILSEPLSPDLARDLGQVFQSLLDYGADPQWVDPRFGSSLASQVVGTPLAQLIR
jgi:ankyrin repeat protein